MGVGYLYTGLRHEAALNLRASDVDAERRILWIRHDKAGRREQPCRILADYLADYTTDMDAEGYLYSSARAKSGKASQMSSIFARCVERAGIAKHVTPTRCATLRRLTLRLLVWTRRRSR